MIQRSLGTLDWPTRRLLVWLRKNARQHKKIYDSECERYLGKRDNLNNLDINMMLACLQAIPAAVVVKKLDGTVVWGNTQFELLTQEKLAQSKGKTALELYPSLYARVIMAHDAWVVKHGKALQVVESLPADDGTERKRFALRFPVRNASGQTIYIAALGFDIPALPSFLWPLHQMEILNSGVELPLN